MSLVPCTTLNGETVLVPQASLIFRPAVYGVIIHNEQVLLVTTRRTGNYYFPGGAVELGERIEEALVREVREETGLEIEVGPLFHFEEHCFFYDPTAEAWHGLLFFYHCMPRSFKLIAREHIQDDEADTPDWLKLHALQPEQFQHAARGVVRKLLHLDVAKHER